MGNQKGGIMQGNDDFFLPVSGLTSPRFAGIPTFMRLPHVGMDHARVSQVQIGLIGAPWDGGTTNRAGARSLDGAGEVGEPRRLRPPEKSNVIVT